MRCEICSNSDEPRATPIARCAAAYPTERHNLESGPNRGYRRQRPAHPPRRGGSRTMSGSDSLIENAFRPSELMWPRWDHPNWSPRARFVECVYHDFTRTDNLLFPMPKVKEPLWAPFWAHSGFGTDLERLLHVSITSDSPRESRVHAGWRVHYVRPRRSGRPWTEGFPFGRIFPAGMNGRSPKSGS